MSHTYAGPNRAAREALALVLDKAWEMPARGVHVGRGPHVPMPNAWDGLGSVPPGWTSHLAHRDDVVVWLPEPETASKLARLTPQEQALLAAARLAATADATPAEPEGSTVK